MGQAMDTDNPRRSAPGIDTNTNAPPRAPADPQSATMPKGSAITFADGSVVHVPPAEEHAKAGAHGIAGAEATSHAKKRCTSHLLFWMRVVC